jgi:myo-inositol-hexaphosphate 3-phosphohydrolase
MDEWIDLVMEINRIEYLKELTVRYDLRKEGSNYINSPANTYYLDDIVFNRDQDPRTHIETGIKLPAVSTLAKITTADGAILISTAKNAQIQVYNIVGRLIHSAQDLKKVELPVEKGVYVVNIIAGGEKQTAKVLVK